MQENHLVENFKAMTNEQKAKQLYHKYRETDFARESAAFNAAMEMAEWKDRQYAKVLTKLIVELDELKHQVKSLLP